MAKDYHGPKPVTSTDKKMAADHLNATRRLLLSKITDHQKAKAATLNPKSKAYNQSHLASHQKDLQEVNSSLNTLKGVSMINTQKTGSYKGKMTDRSVSPGLAAFIGRKKFGAKRFAAMAAKR